MALAVPHGRTRWELDYPPFLYRPRAFPGRAESGAADPTASLALRRWLFSAGAEVRLTVFGTGVVLTYGRDLLSGTNAFFAALAGH